MRRVALGTFVVLSVGALVFLVLRGDEGRSVDAPEDAQESVRGRPELIGGPARSRPVPDKRGARTQQPVRRSRVGAYSLLLEVMRPDGTPAESATVFVAQREDDLVFAHGRSWTAKAPAFLLQRGAWWIQVRQGMQVASHPVRITRDLAGQTLRLFLSKSDKLFVQGRIVLPDELLLTRPTVFAVPYEGEDSAPWEYERRGYKRKVGRVSPRLARYHVDELTPGRYWLCVALGRDVDHVEQLFIGDEPIERDLRVPVDRGAFTPVVVRGPNGERIVNATIEATFVGQDLVQSGAAVVRRRDGTYLVRPRRLFDPATRSPVPYPRGTHRMLAYHPDWGQLQQPFTPGQYNQILFQFKTAGFTAVRLAGLPKELLPHVEVSLFEMGVEQGLIDNDGWVHFGRTQPGAYEAPLLYRSHRNPTPIHIGSLSLRIPPGDQKIEVTVPPLYSVRVLGVAAGAPFLTLYRITEDDERRLHQHATAGENGVTLRFVPAGRYEVVAERKGRPLRRILNVPDQTTLRLD